MVYPPFPAVFTALLCSCCALWKIVLKLARVFSSVVCLLSYLMYSLKVAICTKRIIHFDNIIALEIMCPHDIAKSRPLFSWLTIQERGSTGL